MLTLHCLVENMKNKNCVNGVLRTTKISLNESVTNTAQNKIPISIITVGKLPMQAASFEMFFMVS